MIQDAIQTTLGIIEKMRIEVYLTKDYSGDPLKTIFVQLNPEKYSIKQNVIYNEDQASGSAGQDLQFIKIEEQEVSFEFLFDSTGIVPPSKIVDGKGDGSQFYDALTDAISPAIANPFGKTESVEEEVEKFKTLLMGFISSTHQTSYLRLIWGGYLLNCRLKSMDIDYYVFRKDGRPIRAKVKCGFKGTIDYQLMVAKQDAQSSDLTHERIFKMGDKLTLTSESIYNNDGYYIDVAKQNKLLTFRNIAAGTVLQFPPVK